MDDYQRDIQSIAAAHGVSVSEIEERLKSLLSAADADDQIRTSSECT